MDGICGADRNSMRWFLCYRLCLCVGFDLEMDDCCTYWRVEPT